MSEPTPTSFRDRARALRADDWPTVEPLVRELLGRPVEDPAEFEGWLEDRSELDAACSEARADLYIEMTRHTDDPGAAGRWTRYLEEVQPPLQRAAFDLDRRQHELHRRFTLDPERYAVLARDTAVDVELFRDENVPLETELGTLDQEYDRLVGAMTVRFDGAERPLPEMARYLEETDRSVRERAWRATADRRLQDREAIDAIYDRMIALRHTLARNAGFETYRDYAFRRLKRFDYTPADCAAYHGACESCVVPLQRDLDRARAGALGAEPLRPWDLAVDPLGRAPLRPFADADELVERTARVFARMSPELAALFESLRGGGCLDLAARKGKAPGGYQYMRDRTRTPFIFMNAAGLHADARTLIHEAGHAFHSLLCRGEPLVHYRHSPIEFAEVASMSMELLSMDFWDEYYDDPDDLARARREQLEGVVGILPWVATIDAFQHWVYLHPSHTRAERTSAWLEIADRFGRAVSWDGLQEPRAAQWQRQSHLFGAPFYYIEYGIAQLGAAGLWLTMKERGLPAALDAYTRALSLGGSRPLPDLFAAAGLPFDFSPATVERLTAALARELEALPA